jgi:hypothetical protein
VTRVSCMQTEVTAVSFDNQPFEGCGTIGGDGDFSRETQVSRCTFVYFAPTLLHVVLSDSELILQ